MQATCRQSNAGKKWEITDIFHGHHGSPSGKHTKNDGTIHHFSWANQLFRLGHFQSQTVRFFMDITNDWMKLDDIPIDGGI